MELPPSLRAWFVVHAALALLVGVPLLLAPELVLASVGWAPIDPVATRLVAAALLAIGWQSFLGRNEGVEVYSAMLRLKVIWSLAAVCGLFAAVGAGAPAAAWALLAAFVALLGVWSHYAIRLKQLRAALPDDDEPPAN